MNPPRVEEPGASFRTGARVHNAGATTGKSFRVGYYLSRDRRLGRGDVALAGARLARSLRARRSSVSAAQVSLPQRATAAPYFVLVCADIRGQVRERNERNNCAASARTVFVAFRPAAPAFSRQPSGLTSSTAAQFGFESGDGRPAAGFRCRLDDEPFAPCTSPADYRGLAEGAHTFEVRAFDAFGRDGAVSRAGWRIDATAPAIPVVSGPTDPSNATTASFTIIGVEPGARLECSFDWAPADVCASPWSRAGLGEGRHVFAVRARDGANNESAFRIYEWTVDLTAPAGAPAITASPQDPTRSTSATFRFTSAEGGVSFRCALDGGELSVCSSPHTYSGLGHGTHTFTVRARDAAGNESAARTQSWRVDIVPPTFTLSSRPANPTGSRSATFAFTASEAITDYKCKLDASPAAACWSPQTYAGPLAEGTHTFTLSGKDAVGNEGSTSFSWRVDLTLPGVPALQTFPENPTSSRSATFAFVATGAVSYQCKLDGAASFSPCTNPQTYNGVADGAHRLEFAAVDAAGNRSETGVYRWMVDNTPPPAASLDLGVYRFGGPADVRAFATWATRPITLALDYLPGDTWANLSAPDYPVARWQNSGFRVVYSTPMLPASGASLDEGAKGSYDAYFVSLARTLVNYGQSDAVIRLGWEFNGFWFPWAAKGKTAEFIQYWRRIVTAMRSVSSQFTFDWNPAYGPLDFNADAAYPGDAYVDYIGLVVFDQGWEPGYHDPVLRWRNFINLPFAMQWHQDFAAAHGKPMTYPEWGLTFRDDFPGHGGGDNPYYVEKMYQWLNANDVAYAFYFDHDNGSTRHSMYAGHFPNAATRFKQLFGSP